MDVALNYIVVLDQHHADVRLPDAAVRKENAELKKRPPAFCCGQMIANQKIKIPVRNAVFVDGAGAHMQDSLVELIAMAVFRQIEEERRRAGLALIERRVTFFSGNAHVRNCQPALWN